MITFHKMLENMEIEKAFGQKDADSKSMAIIRAGINLREDFWDDFMNLCGNAEGLSQLLDVQKDKIGSWSKKIQDLLDKASTSDGDETPSRKEMLPTGEGDMEDNVANPNGHPDHVEDLRPTP